MRVWSESFEDGGALPARLAFGKPHAEQHVALSDNRSPHLAWSDLPKGTRSLVIVCSDPDVPTLPDDVNREGVTVPRELPRAPFYHWGLVDLAPDAEPLAEGEFSNGVTPRGKQAAAGPRGVRQAANDYTQWFAGDADMAGTYYGYDGPCPPWNDERVHHYRFTLYALDVPRCAVDGTFRAPDVLAAIEGHVLAQASVTGTYAIYPNAK
ncbi:MAG: YbhB/YbcL family Raf kinase inhibitor-like protein [Myxococcales bacterium]|nr:YbhB/YbcL family Raf kinase inhibitor-like protein [Myxococcales bacterium]MDH5307768.1 YbhB/YbcL family Raf kinase inhibitor-like protein [Myxococcales bacterium]MDH5567603.1 YbhB/YbcL family Raf kinase inhibitor-like protein [Myxococcales bacterium]